MDFILKIAKRKLPLHENSFVKAIDEVEVHQNHVHMLVELSLNISVLSFVGYLKGKSILIHLRENRRNKADKMQAL